MKQRIFIDSTHYALTVGGRKLFNIYEAGIYSGLGMLKKWSIKNHLEVMTGLTQCWLL